jgi:hypothetical protein
MIYEGGTPDAFQVYMHRTKFIGRAGNGDARDWREICKEVLQESSQERLNALLEELLDALEKCDGSKPPTAGSE